MERGKVYRAIGLMSGTSLDGVDAALLETDGQDYVRPLSFLSEAYDAKTRELIRGCLGKAERNKQVEQIITDKHIELIRRLGARDTDVIGFHGQTVYHDPARKITVQLGDGARMAEETGIPVVSDFRSADVQAGGQGAPLLPLYHRARAKAERLAMPLVILNIGGVANVTWIGENKILAFDTGPGNALMDDWVKSRTGGDFDADGVLARSGYSADYLLEKWYEHPYFKLKPPKSLDRDAWNIIPELSGLNDADGAATLMVFTAESILASLDHLPQKPKAWYVTGGGRKNKALMTYLQAHLSTLFRRVPVKPVEELGWNGDAIEAEGFGYLAVRSLLGEPISLPETTGVPQPLTGGVLHRP